MAAPAGDRRAIPAHQPTPLGARCFVAVWPDAQAAQQLDALAARLHAAHRGTRRMRRANLHLTLAFIGDLPIALQQQVARALQAINCAPFNWQIDRIGAFAGARVLWAGSAPDPRLAAVAAQARTCLDALQVGYDRKPFVPHVTLLRDLARADAAQVNAPLEAPIRWPVIRPVLLRSVGDSGGVRYVDVPAEPLPS
jgi:2'-5' RNA ligase